MDDMVKKYISSSKLCKRILDCMALIILYGSFPDLFVWVLKLCNDFVF